MTDVFMPMLTDIGIEALAQAYLAAEDRYTEARIAVALAGREAEDLREVLYRARQVRGEG